MSQSTIAQLQALLPKLNEGDRIRLLKFAEALLGQRSGKKKLRQNRHIRRNPNEQN